MLDQETPPAADGAAESRAEAASTQRLNGVIDVARSGRVAGWAIDRADPEAAVDVEIHRDGRCVAKVRADRHREDLVRNGIGTGNYGFVAELGEPVEPGMAFAVTAVACGAGGLRQTLRPIGKAAPATDPDRRLLERIFEEIATLRGEIAQIRRQGPETGARAPGDMRETMERIEIVQARLEETAAAAGSRDPAAADAPGLRAIAVAALAIAIGSLALGIASMWFA